MIRTQVLKQLPGARKVKRGESKRNVRGGATSREAMEKSRYVIIIKREEVKRDDPIEYVLSAGSEVSFEFQTG